MKKKPLLSEKDKKSWEDFLKNSSDIQDKEEKETEKKIFGRYKFDLHGLSIEKATKKVTEIINKPNQKQLVAFASPLYIYPKTTIKNPKA